MATETNKPIPKQPRVDTRETLDQSSYEDRIEYYSPERIAEFLLNNAVTADDYAAAIEEVRKLGIDPATVPHERPSGG